MAVVTSELEISSSVPAPKLFKAFYPDFDTIGPKVDGQTYKSLEIIQGDGGAGTIKKVTFGDGVPYTSGMIKIDPVDVANLNVTFTFFEGDVLMGVLDSTTHHVQVVPSADGGSVYKHKIVYKCKGDNKLTVETLTMPKRQSQKPSRPLRLMSKPINPQCMLDAC